MRLITSSLVAVGAVAGISGAVVAYQSTTTVPVADQRPAAAAEAAAPVKPIVKVRLLPCEKGTKLQGKACVRVRHVVVERAVPAAPSFAPAASTSTSKGRSNDGRARGKKPETRDVRPSAAPTKHEADEAEHESEHESEDDHDSDHDEHEDD